MLCVHIICPNERNRKCAAISDVATAFSSPTLLPKARRKKPSTNCSPPSSPYYEAHCLDATAPYDGILPLLAELKRRGVKMAIVSNKGDAAVKTLAKQLFGGLIEIAVGESENVRRKPNPDTVLAAMRELGSAKEECVYVGDSEVDFKTACNAEIPCISCLWGFRDEDFLREQGANIFVRKPEEVLAVFSGLQ